MPTIFHNAITQFRLDCINNDYGTDSKRLMLADKMPGILENLRQALLEDQEKPEAERMINSTEHKYSDGGRQQITPLQLAMQYCNDNDCRKHLPELQRLIILYLEFSDLTMSGEMGDTLEYAVNYHSCGASVMAAILEKNPALISSQSRPLVTAACVDKQGACIQVLLRAGADVNATTDASQWTALHQAVYADNMPAVQLLLAAGANPDARDRFGRKPTELGHQFSAGLAEPHDRKQLEYGEAHMKANRIHAEILDYIATFQRQKEAEAAAAEEDVSLTTQDDELGQTDRVFMERLELKACFVNTVFNNFATHNNAPAPVNDTDLQSVLNKIDSISAEEWIASRDYVTRFFMNIADRSRGANTPAAGGQDLLMAGLSKSGQPLCIKTMQQLMALYQVRTIALMRDKGDSFANSVNAFFTAAVDTVCSDATDLSKKQTLERSAQEHFKHRHSVRRALADVLVILSGGLIGVARICNHQRFFPSAAPTRRESDLQTTLASPVFGYWAYTASRS